MWNSRHVWDHSPPMPLLSLLASPRSPVWSASIILTAGYQEQILAFLLPVAPSFPFLQRHLAPRQSQKALPRSYLRACVGNHSSSAAPRLPFLLRCFHSLCKHQSSGLPEAAHHRWSSLEDQVAGGVRQHMGTPVLTFKNRKYSF